MIKDPTTPQLRHYITLWNLAEFPGKNCEKGGLTTLLGKLQEMWSTDRKHGNIRPKCAVTAHTLKKSVEELTLHSAKKVGHKPTIDYTRYRDKTGLTQSSVVHIIHWSWTEVSE